MGNKMPCPCPMCPERTRGGCVLWVKDHCEMWLEWMKGENPTPSSTGKNKK